jgi:DNA-binding CsgD family transcriptional regulator
VRLGTRGIPLDHVEEHIAWLRSFHMTEAAIARELGLSEEALQKRVKRSRKKASAAAGGPS